MIVYGKSSTGKVGSHHFGLPRRYDFLLNGISVTGVDSMPTEEKKQSPRHPKQKMWPRADLETNTAVSST
jgi:hypothetical protein